jgi:hypothetical protein
MLILFSQLRKWKGLQRRRMRRRRHCPPQRTGPASPLADIPGCTRSDLSHAAVTSRKVLRAKRQNLFVRHPIQNWEAVA